MVCIKELISGDTTGLTHSHAGSKDKLDDHRIPCRIVSIFNRSKEFVHILGLYSVFLLSSYSNPRERMNIHDGNLENTSNVREEASICR